MGQVVENVDTFCDLGVMIDNKLRFNRHILYFVAKAHQRANIILRCFITRDVGVLMKAFNTYVLPILDYCSPVWSPSYKCDVETIEKSATTLY